MKTGKLGPLTVSAVGMGCMGFTHAYGDPPPEEEGIRLVHEAFDEGCNFFDTAEMYSYFKNEKFVGKALKELPRDKVVISDKFWPTALPGQEEPKLSEPHLRRALEDSLRRLVREGHDLKGHGRRARPSTFSTGIISASTVRMPTTDRNDQ